MSVLSEASWRETSAAIHAAVNELAEIQAPLVQVAQFVPARRKVLVRRKARFVPIAQAWPLGVLLLTPEGSLFGAGETTRAIEPGYPGHTSLERERRREITKAAFESGFELGAVVHFDTVCLQLDPNGPGDTFLPEGPLVLIDGALKVRWNRSLPASYALPLVPYLTEQVSLTRAAIEPKS